MFCFAPFASRLGSELVILEYAQIVNQLIIKTNKRRRANSIFLQGNKVLGRRTKQTLKDVTNHLLLAFPKRIDTDKLVYVNSFETIE